MKRLLPTLSIGLVLIVLFVQTNENDVLFCFTNNICTGHYNQSCLTFKHFLESYRNSRGNFTLVFLKGYHEVGNESYIVHNKIKLTLVGVSREAAIYHVSVIFINVHKYGVARVAPV